MKKLGLFITMIAVVATLAFAGGASEKTEYVFGADATWPPFEFIDEKGNLTGFDVELVELIGEKVNMNFVAKNIPWDTIFAGLLNGQYDGVASGVTVTEERMKTIDFSTVYAQVGQVVIVPMDSTITGINDLEGKKVGVQIGTTGDFALDDYNTDTKKYDDIGLAIEDMLNGNISAAVCDSLIANSFVLKNDKYSSLIKIVGDKFTTEDYAIGVKKGNTELLEKINEGLALAEADGSLQALKEKWGLV